MARDEPQAPKNLPARDNWAMTLFAFGAWLLFIGTAAVVAAAVVGGLVAWKAGRPRWARTIGLVALAWLALYGALLATTSLASRETILPPDTPKRFCGAYLDCHPGVQVVDARRADALGPRGAAVTPRNGAFAVVSVRVSSTAVRATLPLVDPVAVLRDGEGRAWPRDPEAERALATPKDLSRSPPTVRALKRTSRARPRKPPSS